MAMKDAAEEIVEMALESRVTKAMPLFDITPTPSLFVYNNITPSLCLVYPLVCWCQTTTPHQDYST